MASRFCYHAEICRYCILDVPGLNVDFCFQRDQLSACANEIKEKIASWQLMDLHLAANEISMCSNVNAYQHRVNSYPEAPLALFSPLLRRLCVLALARALSLNGTLFSCSATFVANIFVATGQHAVPMKICGICCGAVLKVLIKS
jgi:hypothetical protein